MGIPSNRQSLDAHTPRTSHAPVKEPLPEPDETPGPIEPDSGDADDSVESPEPPRQPGKRPV